MKEYQRRFLCVLLAALFLLSVPFGAPARADEGGVLLPGEEGFRYEGEGFDTPEDAALYYLAGLKNQDFEQMLAAFAWETQADHFDFRSFTAYMKGFNPVSVPGMPFSNGLLYSAELEEMRTRQAWLISRALELFVNNEMETSATRTVIMKDEAEIDEYFGRCDNGWPEQFASLENIRIYTPDDVTEGMFSHEMNQASYQKRNARYGADETRDVIVFADTEAATVGIMPVAARYGDRWYLVSTSSMTSMILGIAVNCQAVFAVPEELAETVKGIEPAARVSDLPDRNREAIRYEGSGFGTPEEAAEYYLEGLKNQNIQQMLGAFAWETQNSRYSLKDYILRMQCVNETAAIRMPAFSSLMAGSNLCSLRYVQANRIQKALRRYVLAEADRFSEFLEGYNVSFDGEEDIDAFIALYDNDRAGKLAAMSGVRFADPASVIPKYDTEQTKELLGKYRDIYGAEEIRELIGTADLGGETLLFNPILARYGGRWYIVTIQGIAFSLLGADYQRQAFFTFPGTLEDYLRKLQQ